MDNEADESESRQRAPDMRLDTKSIQIIADSSNGFPGLSCFMASNYCPPTFAAACSFDIEKSVGNEKTIYFIPSGIELVLMVESIL